MKYLWEFFKPLWDKDYRILSHRIIRRALFIVRLLFQRHLKAGGRERRCFLSKSNLSTLTFTFQLQYLLTVPHEQILRGWLFLS